SSKPLKSYSQGSILMYQSHSDNWYSATVVVNGKRFNGFINKADVDGLTGSTESLKGIALVNSTAVFSSVSTGSTKLKQYSEGTILQYSSFSENWYKAQVIMSGKKRTGYILKEHVESSLNADDNFRGI